MNKSVFSQARIISKFFSKSFILPVCLLFMACVVLSSSAAHTEEAAEPTADTPALKSGFCKGIIDQSKGWQELLSGNLDAAEKSLLKEIEDNSSSYASWSGLIATYNQQGRFTEAGQVYVDYLDKIKFDAWSLEYFLVDLDTSISYLNEKQAEVLYGKLEKISGSKDLDPVLKLFAKDSLAELAEKTGKIKNAADLRAELPFIRDWMVLGPFANRDKGGFIKEYEAEKELPVIYTNKVYEGRGRNVSWFQATVGESGRLSISSLMHPSRENVAYASTTLAADAECEAQLVFGGSGVAEIFVNGRKRWGWEEYNINYSPVQRVFKIKLDKNPKRITVKCGSESGKDCVISLAVIVPEGKTVKVDSQAAINSEAAALAMQNEKTEPFAKDSEAGLGGILSALTDEMNEKSNAGALANFSYSYISLIKGLDDKHFSRTRPVAERAVKLCDTCPLFSDFSSIVQSDANKSRGMLQENIAASKDNMSSRLLLLDIYLRGGLLREAEKLATACEEIHSTANALEALGDISKSREWKEEAAAYYRRALEMRPFSGQLYRKILELLSGREEKIALLRQSNKITGNPNITRMLVKMLLEDTSESKPKKEELRALVQTNLLAEPFSQEDWSLLCDIEMRDGNLKGAEEILLSACARLNNPPEFIGRIGKLALRNNDPEKAIENFRKSLALNNDQPEIREYLKQIEPKRKSFYDPYEMDTSDLLVDRPTAKDYPKFEEVTLFDQGVVRVNPSGTRDFMIRSMRLAITDTGAQILGHETIGYDPERERVEVLVAQTIQPDGSIISASNISDRSGQGGAGQGTVYSQYHYKAITFADVKPGSVVEIKYVIESKGPNVYGDEFEETFFFGNNNPAIRFNYVIDAPDSLGVQVRTFHEKEVGATRTETKKDGRTVWSWNAENIPGFETEPSMPPSEEFMPAIRASSFASWEEVGSWYWNLSREAFDLPQDIQEEVRTLIADCKTDTEKLEKIYYEIIDKIRYVSVSLGRSGYVPHKAERTWRSRYGDCKDTAVLFVSMLKVAGIDARVALVRTWDLGHEPTGQPGARRFNHAICYVPDADGKEYWLDGTTDFNHFSELPTMDQGAMSLITGPDGGKLVTIKENPASENCEHIDCEINVKDDLSATINTKMSYAGAYASYYRSVFESPDRFRNMFSTYIARQYAGAKVVDFKTSSSNLKNLDVWFSFTVEMPKLAEEFNGTKRVQPWFLPQRFGRFAAQNERKHDLIIGLARRREYSVRVILPEGSEIKSLPGKLNSDDPFGILTRDSEADKNECAIELNTELRMRRVKQKDYTDFRAFCHEVDSAEEEWIVY